MKSVPDLVVWIAVREGYMIIKDADLHRRSFPYDYLPKAIRIRVGSSLNDRLSEPMRGSKRLPCIAGDILSRAALNESGQLDRLAKKNEPAQPLRIATELRTGR